MSPADQSSPAVSSLEDLRAERKQIVEAAELLGHLPLRYVELKEEGPILKEGVSRDRIPS